MASGLYFTRLTTSVKEENLFPDSFTKSCRYSSHCPVGMTGLFLKQE